MNVAMLGAGAWGTALAINLSDRHRVTLWGRDPAQLAAMRAERANRRYLPGIVFPEALGLSADLATCAETSDLTVVAVPTAALRGVLRAIADCAAPVVWLCKGFESDSALLPHQVAQQELRPDRACGALSGPSFAQEVARGLPAALTFAARDAQFARATALRLHSQRLRIYSTDDLVGVEFSGAAKNVIAIAAGICDGLDLGLSARAALIARGLAELTRLGLELGGRAETFGGLAGAGDLILTCTGELSRNHRLGRMLAQGSTPEAALASLGHVAEGAFAAPELARIAERHAVEMPITMAVCRVLRRELSPREAVVTLLSRDPKAEFQAK